jgi:hypothetical protein
MSVWTTVSSNINSFQSAITKSGATGTTAGTKATKSSPAPLAMCYPTNTPIPYVSSSNKNDKKTPATPATAPTPALTPIHFKIECKGLKPNTIHKLYYEGIDVSDYCKKIGAPDATSGVLKTSDSGTITINFNYESDIERYVDGLNEVNYDLAGDKKFELRATGSSASKIIPFKY